MNRTIDKARALYRTLGLRSFLARLMRHTVAKISSRIYSKHTELLILKTLNPEIDDVRSGELQIRRITKQDSSLIQQFNEKCREKHAVVASACYLKNDYRGFVAVYNGELAGYLWWVSTETDPPLTHPCIERFELSLKDDEVYAFDYFVALEYREQGTPMRFLSLIYRELQAMGYHRVWAFVDAPNAPARWLYRAQGNRVVKQIISHEVFSWFLFQDTRVFIKNTRWNPRHSFDHRLLFPLKAKTSQV